MNSNSMFKKMSVLTIALSVLLVFFTTSVFAGGVVLESKPEAVSKPILIEDPISIDMNVTIIGPTGVCMGEFGTWGVLFNAPVDALYRITWYYGYEEGNYPYIAGHGSSLWMQMPMVDMYLKVVVRGAYGSGSDTMRVRSNWGH